MNRVNFTAEYCFLKPLLGKKLQYLTNQHVLADFCCKNH